MIRLLAVLMLLDLIASAAVAADSPPLRYVLQAYNGDPKQPETLDFQVSTFDRNSPTYFYKLGEVIAGTNWKLESFQWKESRDSKGADMDVSELRLRNTKTKKTLILTVGNIVELTRPTRASD